MNAFRRCLPLLLWYALPLTLAAQPQRETAPPDKGRVARALDDLKREEGGRLREASRQSHVLGRFGDWAKDHVFFLRGLAVCGAVLLLLVIVYLVVRFLSARSYRRRQPRDRRTAAGERRAFDPGHIERLAADGRFNEAVLYLHRLSIERLLADRALLSRNLTNQAILSRLRDATAADSFRVIADASERVLFDRCELSRERYAACRAAFRRAFGSEA